MLREDDLCRGRAGMATRVIAALFRMISVTDICMHVEMDLEEKTLNLIAITSGEVSFPTSFSFHIPVPFDFKTFSNKYF